MNFHGLLERLKKDVRLLENWAKPKPKPKPTPEAKAKPATKGPTKGPTQPPKPSRRITMYDSIEVDQIPPKPEAVAGYVGGKWPTYKAVVAKFPTAKHLSIAIAASEDAECLDIEAGDATIAQAPAWVERQHKRGNQRPVLYISLFSAKSLIMELAKHGIPKRQIRLWTAHYTYVPHICNAKCGYGLTGEADATQFTDKALNRNLDQSLCQANFFQH